MIRIAFRAFQGVLKFGDHSKLKKGIETKIVSSLIYLINKKIIPLKRKIVFGNISRCIPTFEIHIRKSVCF